MYGCQLSCVIRKAAELLVVAIVRPRSVVGGTNWRSLRNSQLARPIGLMLKALSLGVRCPFRGVSFWRIHSVDFALATSDNNEPHSLYLLVSYSSELAHPVGATVEDKLQDCVAASWKRLQDAPQRQFSGGCRDGLLAALACQRYHRIDQPIHQLFITLSQ